MRSAWWTACALASAVAAAGGCRSLASLGNAATHTVVYRKNGFTVEDIRRVFTYDADQASETVEIEGRLTLVDLDGDGLVDEVQNAGGEWTRGEPGADGVFTNADVTFADVRDYLRIDGYRSEWDAMTPESRAGRGGLDTRP